MNIDTIIRVSLAMISFSSAMLSLFSDQVRKPLGYWLFGILMLGFSITLFDIYRGSQESLKSAKSGTLIAEKKYSSFPAYFPVYNNKDLQIRIGNSETYLILDTKNWLGDGGPGDTFEPRALFVPISGEEEYKIYFWMEKSQPRIRVKVYNRRLQLVAEIDGNRWNVNRNYLYDLNFDSEAIEIRDDEGRIQLQIIFYKNLIQFSYISYSPLGGYAMVGYPNQGASFESFPLNEKSSHTIHPLFKYPSAEFQGVRL